MPLNKLFSYTLTQLSTNAFEATITIDFTHDVFRGHFPGKPVLPGVTQIELIRQMLSDYIGKSLILVSARDIKYLTPMVPENAEQVIFKAEITETDEDYILSGSFSNSELIFTKIRGVFREK